MSTPIPPISTESVVKESDAVDAVKGELSKVTLNETVEKVTPPPVTSLTVRSNAKAVTYARKFTKPGEVQRTSQAPKYNNDLMSKININQNLNLDSGPEMATIDCQPDYRNIFLVLCYHVTKIYQDLNIKDNPLLTPASMLAYLFSIVYGHALISETSSVRNTRSEYANDFTSVDQRRDLLAIIERMPVPPFMEEILMNLMPTSDPRRPGIQFVHSLACYLFKHDYGRAYPIVAFLRAHNLIASRQANVPIEDTMNAFYDSPLIQHNDNTVLYIRNIFGARTEIGTYPSQIVQAVETIFNPVTQRSQSQRPVFSKINTYPLESQANNDINPYIYLLGADDDNVQTVSMFLESMGNILGPQLGCNRTVATTYELATGIGIQSHYYSPISFPTYYPPHGVQSNNVATARQMAEQLGHMTRRPAVTNTIDIPIPANDPQLFVPQIYLRERTATPYAQARDADPPVLFDTRCHLNPDVVYFNPWDMITSSISYNVVNGLHIETSYIAGFSVPHIDSTKSLVSLNSQFLNSAIPAEYIHEPFTITNNAPFVHIHSNTGDEDTQIVRLSTGNLSQNRLASFDSTIPVANAEVPRLQGVDKVQHIGSFRRVTNTFCFQHGTNDEPSPTTSWDRHTLYAWSSYRYMNTNLRRSAPRDRRIQFILDFRTVYGTNVTVAKSKHPFVLIPKA